MTCTNVTTILLVADADLSLINKKVTKNFPCQKKVCEKQDDIFLQKEWKKISLQ